jgi:hypothetical protein
MCLQIEIPEPPYRHLKKQLPEVDSNIRFVIPIMLDKVSVERLSAEVDTMSWRSTFSTAFLSLIDSSYNFLILISNPLKNVILSKNGWCQELVRTFLTSKKLLDFNSRKEKQILMKFNIK